ncbi:MAG: tyrosine-protein phosphatase [Chloroflexota bacterium]
MTSNTRQLNWPNCYNVRDLGGLPTTNGDTTQFGRIIRSDIPARLTAEGRKLMWDYGVRTILDLRTPWQAIEEPSNIAQKEDAPRLPTYVNISIETYKPEVSTEIMNAGSRQSIYCIMLDHYPEQIRLIMEAIANAPKGGVLIHCHAGKDRTGTVSALLLGLVGVSNSDICHDYAQSQVCLWPLWEKIIEEAGGIDESNVLLRPDATAEAMQFVLDHLERRYGGITPYLQTTGLTEGTMATLKKRLI